MEPERRIEKWLRAFAKKRREQAGDAMELRPSARQRLQREIARRGEEKNRGWFASLFSGLRPGLAFAVCFIALGIIGWVLLPNFNQPQPTSLSLAKLSDRKLTPETTAPTLSPPPASVSAPPVAIQKKRAPADKQLEVDTALQPGQPVAVPANREPINAPSEAARETDRTKSTFYLSSNAKTDSAPPSNNAMLAFKKESMSDSLATGGELNKDAGAALPALKPQSASIAGTARTFAANNETRQQTTAQAASAPASAATAAAFDDVKNTTAPTPPATSQLFNRLETSTTRRAIAGAFSAPSPVLASFRVEQNGNDMKVVDADGSVYTGSVQLAQQEIHPVASAATLKSAPATGKIADSYALVPASQNYFFRVAGTNRNLKQNVIFSGNFVPLTNSPFATEGARFGGGGLGGERSNASQSQIDTLLSNSRINGTAVIGNQKPIEVNATPAP